ncbi:MAG: hypothetical protein ACI88H_002448 [Cocleimonas sp.]|jgi:hypothetical protein
MLNVLEKDAHDAMAVLDSYKELRQLGSQDPVALGLFKALEDSIMRIITKCKNTSQNNFTNQDALFLMVQFQSLEDSANLLSSYQPSNSSLQSLASTVGGWIKNSFFPKIKAIGSKLLSILASMATPKEWTVKGKTSALGLGNLELEIKFGP